MLMIREMTKDLGNLKGDMAQNYKTVPVVYGELISKRIITVLVVTAGVPVYLLLFKYEIGYMNLYFYGCLLLLFLFLGALWASKIKTHYIWLHNVLKLIIVAGTFSVILIDVNLILDRVLW